MKHTYTINYEFGTGEKHRYINYAISEETLVKKLKYWLENEYKENKLYYYFYINRDTRDYLYREFYINAYEKYKKYVDNDIEEY